MANFAYKGWTRQGKFTSGKIKANNETEARTQLRILGTNVTQIEETGNSVKGKTVAQSLGGLSVFKKMGLFQPSVSGTEIAVFTKQLSVMIDAGVSVVQGLEMLAKQASNPIVRDGLNKVRMGVEGGEDLAVAMERSPEMFDKLFISLIRAGAAAGQLDVMLKKLTHYVEKAAKLKKQLMSALTYPAIVIVLAIGMTVLMLTVVVPMMAKNFEESGNKLPDLTLFVINLSGYFQNYWYYMVGGSFVAYKVFSKWKSTPKGGEQWDGIVLKLPVFGSLIGKISIARFTSTLGILVAAGISIIEALETCARAAGNKVIENDILRIREEVTKGKGLAAPIADSPLFPPMVSSMVAIGEQSGQVDTMLEKVAAFYEEDVDAAMAAALKLVEPIMFVVIGGIVGFIMVAMYMPVFEMAGNAGG
jgi:type IV pilus assembly protein PilC